MEYLILPSSRYFAINLDPLLKSLCALSYVRYYLEAIGIWEPVTERNKGARNFMLMFFIVFFGFAIMGPAP